MMCGIHSQKVQKKITHVSKKDDKANLAKYYTGKYRWSIWKFFVLFLKFL